ncbi:hypothetical protein Tco_1103225 [Tanacetum coccineum]
MDTIRAQQQALDDELVTLADRLKIEKSNLRLSSTLKSKEPTLQVVLDALKIKPFYNAFEISAEYLKYTMQDFWLPVSRNILHFLTVILKQSVTQVYGAILPQHLTNQAMLESEAYMTYRAYATSEKTPKPKTTKKKADSEASHKTKTTQATKGKRIKSSVKGDKAAKKKKPAETSMDKGLTMLSDVALTEAEQLKLVIERSKTQTHSSHASGSGADEGTSDIPDDDDDEQTNSDNDGDDFAHPKFSTHDDEARQEEVNEEDSFGPRVQTPLHGRDTVMTDAPLPNVQATQETKDTHVILTAPINPEGEKQSSSVSSDFVSNMLNARPDTGIDLIFTLNTEATSLVYVSVTTIDEPPLVLKTLETDFSEFKQTNQIAKVVSSILGIVDAYLANKMYEAVKTVVQLQSERLRDEA